MTWKEAISLKDTLPKTPDKAMEQGLLYFNTRVACKNGHISPRSITSERRCVMCLQEKNKKQREGPNNWIYKAKAAERKACYKAKKIGCLPEDYMKEDCEPFYTLAAIISQHSEVPHEVDHKTPLSLGGLHHPDNLLVISSSLNRDKGCMTEITYHQKVLTVNFLEAISYGHSIGERL
jgi:hypothetical protein